MIIFYLNQFKIEAFDRTADFSLNPLSNNGNLIRCNIISQHTEHSSESHVQLHSAQCKHTVWDPVTILNTACVQ